MFDPRIDYINKSREQQNKELEIIKDYADSSCKKCLGTGKEYWITELKQYKVCDCVFKNIEILKDKQN